MIFPLPDSRQWSDSVKGIVILPAYKAMPGRPKKNRRKATNEPMPGRPKKNRKKATDEPVDKTKASRGGCRVEYSRCHNLGHNSSKSKLPRALSTHKLIHQKLLGVSLGDHPYQRTRLDLGRQSIKVPHQFQVTHNCLNENICPSCPPVQWCDNLKANLPNLQP